MTIDPKILDRIRKLHKHAESAKQLGNTAEAAAFAGKVHELLAQHKLEMSVLSTLEQDQQDPMGRTHFNPDKKVKKYLIAWKRDLARIVARHHGCYLVLDGTSNQLFLIGRESDRAVAQYMITFLILFGLRVGARECIKARKAAYMSDDPLAARGFEAAFHRAFVEAIRERYEAMRAQSKGTKTGTAIVLLDRAVEEGREYANKTMTLRNSNPLRGPSNTNNSLGREAGTRAGRSVDLSGLSDNRVGGGRRALSGGQ